VTPSDLRALRFLAAAENRNPPGLAESNVTDLELGTIYHRTAGRLVDNDPEFGLHDAYEAGRDRYGRKLYRITTEGLEHLAETMTTNTKDTSPC
jgi:hypothetical protein